MNDISLRNLGLSYDDYWSCFRPEDCTGITMLLGEEVYVTTFGIYERFRQMKPIETSHCTWKNRVELNCDLKSSVHANARGRKIFQ